jgi:hypothetical protein
MPVSKSPFATQPLSLLLSGLGGPESESQVNWTNYLWASNFAF